MADQLRVHLNREGPHAVETPEAFESAGSFSIRLVNHGSPTHVHLKLDDGLARGLDVDPVNHYVDAESERVVDVHLDGEGTFSGDLGVVTGYGSRESTVAVTVDARREGIPVDDSLSRPAPRRTDDSGLSGPQLRVLALGGLAALLSVATALIVADPLVAVVVLLVVGAGVATGVAALRK